MSVCTVLELNSGTWLLAVPSVFGDIRRLLNYVVFLASLKKRKLVVEESMLCRNDVNVII